MLAKHDPIDWSRLLAFVAERRPGLREKLRGALPAELEALRRRSPVPLPENYVGFLRHFGGADGGFPVFPGHYYLTSELLAGPALRWDPERYLFAFSSRSDALFSAQPGEGYWGREFSYAYLRNVAWMPEPLRMQAVDTAYGDTGSAAGALALLHALASLTPPRGSPQTAARQAFSYAVSDCGAFGAAALLTT